MNERIIDFDDWEDMQIKARLAEAKANKSVTLRQRDVVYGSYWIRASDNGMLEYGRVLGQQEAERNQTPESVRALRDLYKRGYRWSMAHSVLSREGELGDTHLAVLWPITEDEFRKAETSGFRKTSGPWETEMLLRITHEMRVALMAQEEHDSRVHHNLSRPDPSLHLPQEKP